MLPADRKKHTDTKQIDLYDFCLDFNEQFPPVVSRPKNIVSLQQAKR